MTENFNRVQLDSEVTNQLDNLKSRTGMTPNYLVRIGLCYSLNEKRPPTGEIYDSDGQVLNRYTLLGEHDSLYMALVRKRMLNENRNPNDELYEYFLSHLNRGVETLYGRVDGISDLYDLMPSKLRQQSG